MKFKCQNIHLKLPLVYYENDVAGINKSDFRNLTLAIQEPHFIFNKNINKKSIGLR